MPITVERNETRAQSLVEGGGLKKDTLARRDKQASDVDAFIKSNYNTTLQSLLESGSNALLEEYLIDYFERFRVVKKKDDGSEEAELPKRNTLESAKSGLKNWIETKSKNRVNIMDKGQFPLFSKMMKGLFRDLRRVTVQKSSKLSSFDHCKLVPKHIMEK